MRFNVRFNVNLISKYRAQLYGIAILWIIFYHGRLNKWLVIPASLSWLDTIIRIGDIGVDIFLLLSGMSLYFAYAKKPTLGYFTYRRLIRLYLPYWVICTGFFVYDYLIKTQQVALFGINMSMLGFWTVGMFNIKGTWYMGGILVCYLLYPYLHAFIFSARRNNSIILRTIIILVISYFAMWSMHKYNLDYYNMVDVMIVRFPVFIVGTLLGKYVYEHRSINPVLGWGITVLLFIMFFCMRIEPGYTRNAWLFRTAYLFGAISICYLLAGFMSALDHTAPRIGKALGKPLVFCGGISLELYLTSQMLRYVIGTNDGSHGVVIWIVTMIGAVIFAYVANWVCTKLRKIIDTKVLSYRDK